MSWRKLLETHSRGILAALLVIAVAARVAVRIALGEANFWEGSYSAYYDLARNVASGRGFCFETTCAWWPPLYPAFLALTVFAGKHYLLIVIPQAILGAGTALCAFAIGRRIFNPVVGLLACAGTALYPYYVMHDTALQETGMVKFWTALTGAAAARGRTAEAAGLVAGGRGDRADRFDPRLHRAVRGNRISLDGYLGNPRDDRTAGAECIAGAGGLPRDGGSLAGAHLPVDGSGGAQFPDRAARCGSVITS